MKQIIKVSIIFIFSLIILSISKCVQANSINKITMDINIDNSGNATITEVWDCRTTEGTEVYHPYYNLGNSEISNLRVSEGGVPYQTLNSWNTSGSLSSKANKCGINQISNGVELCWGISSYGTHTYNVQYTISDFVSELSDSQMIYWTLIPYEFSNSIGDVDIKIHTFFNIADTVDVWGYGNYGGLCYVNNGSIYMSSDGTLDTSEYMTVLAKFPLGTFNAKNMLDYDFEYFYNKAEEGAKNYNGNFTEIYEVIFYMVLVVGICGFGALINKITTPKYGFKFGNYGKNIPKSVDYYRDIPCGGDIFKSYYIAYNYGIIKKKTDILGAIVLKWLKAGVISTEKRQTGKTLNKEENVIILGEDSHPKFDNERESELFHMMYVASKDGILENNEFEKWCRKSYETILGWFDDILEEQRKVLVNEGLITITNKNERNSKYVATAELKQEALNIAGLKRYLLDYTLINDREALEVQLFENYLIYAQMLGIADKVSKQFKKLYPDMIEQTNYNSYDNLVYINICTSRGISSANSARAAAQAYSSGGGGFSSGGGGGGSFGGRRRRRRFPLIYVKNLNNKKENLI